MATDQETREEDNEKRKESMILVHRQGGDENLAEETIAIVGSLKSIGEFRRTQRKECQSLVRRMKLFLPLLEEIRDVQKTLSLPESAALCLKKLMKAFQSAKKLLKLCHGGSKIYLAIESESMMVRFKGVYGKISEAVEGMPYHEMGISQEEKEQVELLQVQLRRAKKRIETQDIELTMDLMVATTTNEDNRNADIACFERLASKLSLQTPEELRQETIAINKLIKERQGTKSETTQQIVDLLNKLKKLAGVTVENSAESNDSNVPTSPNKCANMAVPNEFLCPITSEIMTDPVIVATGQTYERESIQNWLDANRTCPKTGQFLSHLSLAPNFALKNLILQWCEKNNYPITRKDESTAAAVVVEEEATAADREEISALVQKLSSSKLDEQREAVEKIRKLSKESAVNRTLIAEAGGIPSIVQLLSYPDPRIQEQAVTALLNLSIDQSNKKLISQEKAFPAIIEILETGTVDAKENSAAALFSLSMLEENKVKIGALNGIAPLVNLLRTGTLRGKKDAMTALVNICLDDGTNASHAIDAGIVSVLQSVIGDSKQDEMAIEALSMLLVLAKSTEGRREVGQLHLIETLVNLIREGNPKKQECAAAVLVELGTGNRNLILAALQYGVYDSLVEVSRNGTERGQRKAHYLLKLMTKAGYLPSS